MERSGHYRYHSAGRHCSTGQQPSQLLINQVNIGIICISFDCISSSKCRHFQFQHLKKGSSRMYSCLYRVLASDQVISFNFFQTCKVEIEERDMELPTHTAPKIRVLRTIITVEIEFKLSSDDLKTRSEASSLTICQLIALSE